MYHNATIYFSEQIKKKVNSKHFRFTPFKINTTFAEHICSLIAGSFRLHISKETFHHFKSKSN